MYLFRDSPLYEEKEVRFALKNVYGVGLRKASYICARVGVGYGAKLSEINDYYFELMHFLLKGLVVSESE